MADLSAEINSKEVNEYLKKFPEETFGQAKLIITNALLKADTTTKKNATSKIRVRTGSLKKSIRHSITGSSLGAIRGSLHTLAKLGGDTLKYAPIHEYGGTIKAKNAYKTIPGGPYLNIPADANKTPAGVQRLSAKMVFQSGGFIPKGKKVVLLNGQVMFYLTKSVKIPARLGMRKAAEDEIPSLLNDLQAAIGEF